MELLRDHHYAWSDFYLHVHQTRLYRWVCSRMWPEPLAACSIELFSMNADINHVLTGRAGMERHEVLQVMLSAGRIYSIAVHDLSSLVLKLTVLSVKYVSKRALWSTRFGEDYVHWELVESVIHKNILGGCAEWLGLLSFCRWDDLGKHEGEIQSSHPPLLTLRKHMRDCNLDVGDGTAWTLVCKMFLLMLIQGLSSMHALDVLTCEIFKRNTQPGCTMLLAKQVARPVFSLRALKFQSDTMKTAG